MELIIGLGNPDPEYTHTRHNLGREAVKFLRQELKFPEFKFKKKFQAQISEKEFKGQKIILALPETFMNNSGQAARLLAQFYKIAPQDICLIYDDLDLPLGTVRIRAQGASAGHKGVQSAIDSLGSDKFKRLRLGLANKLYAERQIKAEAFVLQKFGWKERRKIKAIKKEVVKVLS